MSARFRACAILPMIALWILMPQGEVNAQQACGDCESCGGSTWHFLLPNDTGNDSDLIANYCHHGPCYGGGGCEAEEDLDMDAAELETLSEQFQQASEVELGLLLERFARHIRLDRDRNALLLVGGCGRDWIQAMVPIELEGAIVAISRHVTTVEDRDSWYIAPIQ